MGMPRVKSLQIKVDKWGSDVKIWILTKISLL